jgi:predicted metal-binding protein
MHPNDHRSRAARCATERSSIPRGRFAQDAAELVSQALLLGAGAAAVIPVDRIVVEDALANLCREPRCDSFGLSAHCPPHVPGPARFRSWAAASLGAVGFKIEVPYSLLLGEERREIMGILQQVAAQVEQCAAELGYAAARGFAGGSCRKIFCRKEPDCAVLLNRPCRHPTLARPSMSGFGVDVSQLIAAAGWKNDDFHVRGGGKPGASGALFGLVLIA